MRKQMHGLIVRLIAFLNTLEGFIATMLTVVIGGTLINWVTGFGSALIYWLNPDLNPPVTEWEAAVFASLFFWFPIWLLGALAVMRVYQFIAERKYAAAQEGKDVRFASLDHGFLYWDLEVNGETSRSLFAPTTMSGAKIMQVR